MKKKLINNADDFGYSRAINYGIIDSYLHGALTSTTLMAGMPGFEHAVKLAKENPQLGIGVHLTLTCGKPILKNHKTLVDENGDFKKLSFYENEETHVDDREVYDEWKAQIEKVYNAGIQPTHLDSHHHIHTFKNHADIVKQLAKEYGLPVRNSFEDVNILREAGVKCNDILINPWLEINDDFESSQDKIGDLVNEIQRLLQNTQNYDVIEIMWHPAYLDYSILSQSSFAYPRIIESEAIIKDCLIKYMKDNFELCTYQNI